MSNRVLVTGTSLQDLKRLETEARETSNYAINLLDKLSRDIAKLERNTKDLGITQKPSSDADEISDELPGGED